jgi:hypothetical protein
LAQDSNFFFTAIIWYFVVFGIIPNAISGDIRQPIIFVLAGYFKYAFLIYAIPLISFGITLFRKKSKPKKDSVKG